MTNKSMSVPEAGRLYFDACRDAAYEMARTGVIPTIKIGRRLVVPVEAMERAFNSAADKAADRAVELLDEKALAR